ncbi:MAG: hypothetical protein NBV66_06815 [Burkholderiaceae bacterium]|nr:hypothetical protein [Burkholderiaceae bacterium]
MHLIIPGALPPHTVAADLLPHVQEHCPELVQRIERLDAVVTVCPPEETGCSALEFLELSARGYSGENGHSFGAGLGPLRAGITHPEEPVWVADLCSVAIGRDGAVLAIPESLGLDQAHADALFDAAQPLWSHSGISVLPIGLGRWRVWLAPDARLRSISPAAVSTLSVSDWWPQAESMKAWRKILNEVQMLWHTHPVNDHRATKGLEPINSLWLYGGAPGWKPTPGATDAQYSNLLAKSFLENDWATWISQLPVLSKHLAQLPENSRLSLVGERKIVTLSTPQQSWWQRLVPRRTQNWTTWWIRQN